MRNTYLKHCISALTIMGQVINESTLESTNISAVLLVQDESTTNVRQYKVGIMLSIKVSKSEKKCHSFFCFLQVDASNGQLLKINDVVS